MDAHETRLIEAVLRNDVRTVRIMLAQGTSPDTRNANDEWHRTALIHAIDSGYIDCVELLLQYEADIELTEDFHDRSPVICAIFQNDIKVLKMLLDKGANVNAQDIYSETALNTAAYFGHKDIIDLLLEYGADPDLKNGQNKTPAQTAKGRGFENIEQQIEQRLAEKKRKAFFKDKLDNVTKQGSQARPKRRPAPKP